MVMVNASTERAAVAEDNGGEQATPWQRVSEHRRWLQEHERRMNETDRRLDRMELRIEPYGALAEQVNNIRYTVNEIKETLSSDRRTHTTNTFSTISAIGMTIGLALTSIGVIVALTKLLTGH